MKELISSLERTGFGALVAFLLAPVIAHGLWRPLVHVFGPAGDAGSVTSATLSVCAVVVVSQWALSVRALSARALSVRAPWLPLLLGGLVAAGTSVGLSLGVPGLLTLLCVAGAIAWLERWLSSRLPSSFDGLIRRHRVLTALYLLLALAAVITTARVSTFMGDPARIDQQAIPGDEFTGTHSCLTAYVRAATLNREGVDNLYHDHWWHGSLGLPPLPSGVENPYRPFLLDNFNYPPPFLMLMVPLAPFEGDFYAQRALWFGFNGLILALALWIVARWIDGPGAHRTLLLAPLFFGILPIILNLQIGNFHASAVTLSILAMVAFERGRLAAGGGMLALTILSKISPGVLGIVLLVQRRFRAAAITAGFGGLLFVLFVLWSGLDPIRSFVTYALPRLSSGAAFPFMNTPDGIATNMSPFGFAFKLHLLGLYAGDPWSLGPRIAQVYTAFVILMAIAAGRRRGDRLEQALTWMSLLVLAALQSPFSPGYASLPLLWGTTLLAARVGLRGAIGLVLLWLLALVMVPTWSLELKAAHSMFQTAVLIVVCVWLILRVPRGSGRPDPALTQ